MTKGFITVAVGDYYCKLAAHLYMSYKLFANCSYPFYVITDKDGEKNLKNIFDGVIVRDDFTKTSLDDIKIFIDTPFDETIFIDADCSVVNDLNYLFSTFERNGSDVSAISGIHSLQDGQNGIQFGKRAINELGLTYDFPNFNGGVYYYNKSEVGSRCVDYMLNELLPKYHYYELLGRSNSINMGDEPLVIVAMIKFGMRTVPQETNIMYLVHNPKQVKWVIHKRSCKYNYYKKTVSPSIIHWKVGGTETYNYEKYDAIIRGKYYNRSFFSVKKNQFISFIKYKVYPTFLKVFPSIKKASK